jgi:hypothetical protein
MAILPRHVSSSNVNKWRETLKIIPLLSILAVGLGAPALAQQAAPASTSEAPTTQAPAAKAATAKAGDAIYDTAGEVVGTVESVDGSNLIISTGTTRRRCRCHRLPAGPTGRRSA